MANMPGEIISVEFRRLDNKGNLLTPERKAIEHYGITEIDIRKVTRDGEVILWNGRRFDCQTVFKVDPLIIEVMAENDERELLHNWQSR